MAETLLINSQETWEYLVDEVLMGMPQYLDKRDTIVRHRLCRLIGMLPYIASTDNPVRDGFTNLSLFLLSKDSPVEDVYNDNLSGHKDIMRPLIPFCHFSGGDERLLSRGMHLVAMVLLMDYRKNRDRDLDENRYNPLNSGQWNYNAVMETLSLCVEDVPCPLMDDILSMEFLPFTDWSVVA